MSSDIVTTGAVGDAGEEVLRFGPFTLRPAQRVLAEGEARIHLGSRAFDILLLLLERAGNFVAKDEIVARVWPTTVVVDGNLRVHVTALRKALSDGRDGHRYIVNVPNRGYSFVAPVTRGREAAPTPVVAAAQVPALAGPLHRTVGRDAAIESLSRAVRRHRLVTVVGAGGIGKTTVALSIACAAAAEPSPWSGVHVVDLAPLADGRLASGALAGVLGLRTDADDALPNILAYLHDKSLLLLLDNCEHVLPEIAWLAEAILRAASGVHLLATSREPLRADGERVHRLPPLDAPPPGAALTPAEALRFGAVELFVDRATAALDTFVFLDADVEPVVDICRRLDGIPLAIELAAAFVSSLGVRGVRTALEGRILQARPGRRTAVPRHRTLQAIIEWSHGLLSPRERIVLARISVFCGSFTLESAGAVASDGESTQADVFDAVTALAAKSLVCVDVSREPATFRLLETTRGFAAERLAESGQLTAMRRRHAEHLIELLRDSEVAWCTDDASAWRRRYGRHVDDVRVALGWTMSPEGEPELGIALAARSALLLFQLSRAEESMRYAEAATDAIERLGTADPRLEFELHIICGFLLTHTRGDRAGTQRALEHALELAREHDDRGELALACSANWVGAFMRCDPRAMLDFATRFEALTAGDADPASVLLYDRMKAQALHVLGDQPGARLHAERALAAPTRERPPFLSGAWVDQGMTMSMLLARVLWLQGWPDRAEEAAALAVARARADGESIALAYVLALGACPLAMWMGRLELARERVALLMRHTLEHSLKPWRGFAIAYCALLDWLEGGGRGEPVLPAGFDVHEHPVQLAELLATLHPAWADEVVFARGDAGDAGWCQAELLRVRAGRLRAQGREDVAEIMFLASLERARGDGAVAWELRTATSLARFQEEQGRHEEALELLRSLLGRLAEARATADVREATALHDALVRTVARSHRPASGRTPGQRERDRQAR